MFDVPILYLVFNRPQETLQSFEVFRKIKPAKLYISADGPRNNRTDDIENTEKVKQIVAQVDWECEVKTLFNETNQGCRGAVEAALKWFFSNEAEGIIIEDDIIPNAAFFDFCKIMLHRYRNDKTIFSINGCSIGYQNAKESYGLTRYFNMWGWATWKRTYELVQATWKDFDPKVPIGDSKSIKKSVHLPVPFGGNEKWLQHWQQIFIDTYNGAINTWDHQWVYTAFKTNKYCIRPSENYVVNIGFGENATHHTFTKSPICNLKYSNDVYVDVKLVNPKVDFKYEVIVVCKMVNAVYLNNWRDFFAGLIPVPIKKVIKSIQ
jgi:hypothetical protein